MEMAKVTSKGQITIPISIRRRLGINEGDKILFVNKQEGVLMLNPDAVQGDIADYTADDLPLESTPAVVAKPASKPAAVQKTAATPKRTAASRPAASAAASQSDDIEAAGGDAPDVSVEVEPPVRRKYIPPVNDAAEDSEAKQAGGINLSTLLDDIRSIGSNI